MNKFNTRLRCELEFGIVFTKPLRRHAGQNLFLTCHLNEGILIHWKSALDSLLLFETMEPQTKEHLKSKTQRTSNLGGKKT